MRLAMVPNDINNAGNADNGPYTAQAECKQPYSIYRHTQLLLRDSIFGPKACFSSTVNHIKTPPKLTQKNFI
jgi:hypothetical protein